MCQMVQLYTVNTETETLNLNSWGRYKHYIDLSMIQQRILTLAKLSTRHRNRLKIYEAIKLENYLKWSKTKILNTLQQSANNLIFKNIILKPLNFNICMCEFKIRAKQSISKSLAQFNISKELIIPSFHFNPFKIGHKISNLHKVS